MSCFKKGDIKRRMIAAGKFKKMAQVDVNLRLKSDPIIDIDFRKANF